MNAQTDELAAEVMRLQTLLEQTRLTKTTARREAIATAALSWSVATIPTGATTRAGRQIRRVVDVNFESSLSVASVTSRLRVI